MGKNKRPPLTEKQKLAIRYMLKHPYTILAADPRLGKAQPVTTTVYTPQGPTMIGKLKRGDYVLGANGQKKKVMGVYDKGVLTVYRVHFSDGSSTLCCKDHLWSVQDGNDRARKNPYRVKSTKYLLSQMGAERRWFIPMSLPASFNKKKLEIPPYLLGVLIGDGSINNNSFCITNSSKYIFKKIKKLGSRYGFNIERTKTGTITLKYPVGRENPWKKYIRRVGLNVLSKNKAIPDDYKYTSIEDRLELLRGLLDTDGYIAKDSTTQFTSASEKLCDDVRWLVQSLGGVARKNFKRAKCQTGVFDSWTVTINLPRLIPVTIPHKAKRYLPKQKFNASRKIVSIEKVGKRNCRCISVEGEHYLTDEFIVTHNTRTIIYVQQKINRPCLVIAPSYLISNWEGEIKKWRGDSCVVTSFTRGKDIYEPFDADFVLISYDLIRKAEHLFEWAHIVALDECHAIKEISTMRSQFIHRCIYEYSIKRLYLLSGTIIKNRVKEFYSPVALTYYDPRLKDPKFLDTYPTEIDFADDFSYRQEYKINVVGKRGQKFKMPILKWTGLRNKIKLKKYLKGRYIRLKADEKDLPPLITKEVLISKSQDKKLLKAFNDFFEKDGNSSVKPDIKVEAALKKVPFTIKYAEDLLTSKECILIYSDHVPVIEKIAAHFKVKAITGKMTAKNRSILANTFQAGEGQVLCATVGALKEGKDLFRSKDIILNDLPWVSGDLKQVTNRIRGLGQTGNRTIHIMLGSPQDKTISDALHEKIKVIEAAT